MPSPIVRRLLALGLFLGLALSVSPFTERAVGAVSRPADTAGSDRVGSASYAAPSGAVHAAPWGSDSNSGSASSPVRSLARALALVPVSGTIVLRAGSYNEQVDIYKTVTIQNYPNEEVWLDGSVPVSGWVRDGAGWRVDGWTTRFDHSPTYTKGAPDSTQTYWQFVNKATAPMAAHPDQVWIDGYQQWQVPSLSQLKANTFYLDENTSRLYLGSDPSGKQVRASNITQAMNIRAAGVTVRGIGIRRFAPSVWHVGAVTLQRPNIAFENVVVSEMATTGISVQSSGAQLRKVTVEWSGMLGIHGRYADSLTMTKVLSRRNNSQQFNLAPVSGGVKLGLSRGITVVDSSFRDNYGHGFWEDMSIYNSVFRGTNFIGNSGEGLFLEISAKVVVGDSLFANNKLDGIKVNNTSNVKIWNNTFVGNGRPLDLVQDYRRNTNSADSAVDTRIAFPDPEMPWQLDSVTVSNNVVGAPAWPANCLLCVEDYSHQESAESMKVRADGNVYNRLSSSAPTWLGVWSRGPGNPAVFTTLAALRSSTGQEARGREQTGTQVVSSAGELSASMQADASQVALPLPGDVASLLGKPGGIQRLGAWMDGASTPTTPTSSALARDDFSRTVTGGWGTAVTGGTWATPDAPSRFAVAGGAGKVTLASGDGFTARLNGVSSSQTDLRFTLSADRRAGSVGHFIDVIGRSVGGAGDYRGKFRIATDGKVSLWLLRTVDGKQTAFTSAEVPGLVINAGEKIALRLQVTGTHATALRFKAWRASDAEPGAWTLSATDSTSSLQSSGSIGVYLYTAGSDTGAQVVMSCDDVEVSVAG